jgi:hypothetical protein
MENYRKIQHLLEAKQKMPNSFLKAVGQTGSY